VAWTPASRYSSSFVSFFSFGATYVLYVGQYTMYWPWFSKTFGF
jgi:hypothetical protein